MDAQDALQAAYVDLERRVQERTAELAALHADERERRAEAERSRRIADGMREIVAALNQRKKLGDTLDFIVTHACRMLKSDGAAIFRLRQVQGGEQMLVVQAGCGLDRQSGEVASLPYDGSIAGRVLQENRPIPVPNISAQLIAMYDGQAMPLYLQRSPIRKLMAAFSAMLMTPLFVGGQPYGILTLYYRDSRSFDDDDISEAQSLADQVALAIESARLREREGQTAALDERNRLARELHDSVTQSLYSMTLYAEAAARQVDVGNSGQVTEHLRALRDTSRDALREMRLLIYELQPPEIERTGLAGALRARLQGVEIRGGVHAELLQDGDETIPTAAQRELYHIAREALNNSLKHAQATHIVVRLSYRPGLTVMEIEDDGMGFDREAGMEAGGMGLRTMQERAEHLGAQLEVQTAATAGTTVRVTLKS